MQDLVELVETILSAPAVAVLAGALAGYFLTDKTRRRKRLETLRDDAIAAVMGLQASRHYVTSFPPDHTGLTGDDHKAFVSELRLEGLREFARRAAECRHALAALAPYASELEAYASKFEVAEEEAQTLVALLRRVKVGRFA